MAGPVVEGPGSAEPTLGTWVALCSAAEAVGMTAAAGAARLGQQVVGREPTGGREAAFVVAIAVAAGLVEGAALGVLQGRWLAAWLRRSQAPGAAPFRAGRWLWVTVAVAGLGWAAGSAPAALAGSGGDTAEPALALVLLAAAAIGLASGTMLGVAQSWVLRGTVRHPGRWILASALAWPPTMVVIFLGATVPGTGWPAGAVVLLGTVTGLAAGSVLGAVTALLLPSIDAPARGTPRRSTGGQDRSAVRRIPGVPTVLRALVVDWGGVLTEPLDAAIRAWAEIDGVEVEHYVDVMRSWLGPHQGDLARDNPVAALERGEIEVPDFERQLARRLSERAGRPVDSTGLLQRMFDQFEHAPAMAGLVLRARRAGLLTGLLSNSWGNEYPREGWDEMFDAIVISGEVGMRKPEPEIFAHVLDLLGVEAGQTVFVDDLEHNVRAAESLGLVGVHHTSYDTTASRLEDLFGRHLRD